MSPPPSATWRGSTAPRVATLRPSPSTKEPSPSARALAILGILVVLLVFGFIDPVAAALVCALAMIGTRCVTGIIAKSSIRWDVLIVIGSALGIGQALIDTGAAKHLAGGITSLCRDLGPQTAPRR